MSEPASEYVRRIAALLVDGYPGDCALHAARLAELLIAGGERPWIARLRDRQQTEHGVFHGPLIPRSLRGRHAQTWTTHYVVCVNDVAYDPLASEAVPLHEYAERVFGREIPIETFIDEIRVAQLFASGDLLATVRRG